MPGTIVLSLDTHQEHVDNIVQAIAATNKMVVICGAGISCASGIPDAKSLNGKTRNIEGSEVKYGDLFHNYWTLEGARLSSLNKIMTNLRRKARKARLGNLHHFLHRAFDEGKLLHCLTRNFDGLETRDRADMEDVVSRVHGDNTVLRCASMECDGIQGEDVEALDKRLLSGELIECPACLAADVRQSGRRNRPKTVFKHVRPAVYLDEGLDYEWEAGDRLVELLSLLKDCELLLIVGTSLKTPNFNRVIRELATGVHSGGGAVVYLCNQTLPRTEWNNIIDFHLAIDIEVCATKVLQAMETGAAENEAISWQELLDNVVPAAEVLEVPPYQVPSCSICMFNVTDKLIECNSCSQIFCGQFPNDSSATACIELHCFAPWPSDLPKSLDLIRPLFVCPSCWDHAELGIYPHWVRSVPRFYTHTLERRIPRMVLILYYLAEFWPITKHLVAFVAGLWKAEGWTCLVQPIQLQKLDDFAEVLPQCSWDQGSFSVFVVYITHGMSRNNMYQISDNTSCDTVDFFNLTLQTAQTILSRAASSRIFLLCCGHALQSPANVMSIQKWINDGSLIESVVGCFNTKLSPAFLIGLVAKASVQLIGYEPWSRESLLNIWLRDEISATHTDLLYISRNQMPMMWLFSPFQSRPLGKDLPSLLMTCSCASLSSTSVERPTSHRIRKLWKVDHRGRHGMELRNIEVKAKCSVCKQMWKLPTEHLRGHLHHSSGLYAAVVPYFST